MPGQSFVWLGLNIRLLPLILQIWQWKFGVLAPRPRKQRLRTLTLGTATATRLLLTASYLNNHFRALPEATDFAKLVNFDTHQTPSRATSAIASFNGSFQTT